MKKIILLFVSIILVFSLFSCVKDNILDDVAGDTVKTEDGKQIPVYEGMTVSSIATEKPSGELYRSGRALAKRLPYENVLKNFKDVEVESSEYYADLGEDIFITVHLSNPDKFEILSFTLNGEKYSSYMFERGSDMETIIIKCNVGRESGEHKYTIDAIKYIDKNTIKDAFIRGNQTISVIVSQYEYEANCKHDNNEKITIFEAKQATCEQEGLTEGKKCELCNTVILEQKVVSKLECTPSDWIIDSEATTTEDGLKHVECTVCGKRIKEEVIYSISSEGLEYKVNDDGVSCTVIGMGECTDIDVIIPKYIDGYKVTAIGEDAFRACKSITSVVISKYVTEIGTRAFMNCEAMKEVTLPKSLKVIGEEGFYICASLKTVYYQGNVEDWCSIDFVTGWSSPTGHGTQLYFDGDLVVDLVIPDTVTKIDNHAFFGCDTITSLTIGNGVIEIGDQAFSSCKLLSNIKIGNSVKIIEDCAFEFTPITSIVIPDSVEFIGCEAFFCCKSLTNVVIGKAVSYVHVGAFLDCPNIEYTEYENGLYLGNEDNPYHLLNSVIDNTVSSFKINEKTKAITGNAFNNCISLESITIPNGVTCIGWHLFQYCSSLKNVVIPNSVTRIDESAFDYCTSLTSIVLPQGVTDIGSSAFSSCIKLESINIPAAVTNIGSYALSGCTSLKEIIVDENNVYYKSIDGSLYTKDGKTLIRYVPKENATTYVIPNGVTCIDVSAFSGCKALVEVTIPQSVTKIERGAFSGCTSLASIVIPNSVTSIGSSAFSGCTSLESIVIPNGITEIEGFVFNGCTSLKSVIIPNSVTSIGDRAFMDCTSLTRIVIPESVESIKIWAFRDCTSLRIYCKAKTKPTDWHQQWNYSNRPVVWGYTGK